MIIVAAQLTFSDETSRDHAVKKSTLVQLATREDEPGCLAYCFSADPCDPLSIQVYELWNDSDALVAHFDHPNYHEMLAVMSDAGVLESRNRAYLTERDEPVYGPDFEKKTAFFCDLSR